MRTTILALVATATLSGPALAQDLPPDLVVVEPLVESGDLVTDDKASRDVVVADLDNDTNLDILFANRDQTNDIYWGDGQADPTFLKGTSAESGTILSDVRDSRGLAVADFDGDGDLDVFVVNSSNQANDLFINQTVQGSPRVFVKHTGEELVTATFISRQARFFDVDNDCDLDLFITNFQGQDNELYINQLNPGCGGGDGGGGDGTALFVKALPPLGGDAVTDGGNSYGIATGDIDSDGDIDLYVSNHSGVPWAAGDPGPFPAVQGFLYRNNTVGGGNGVSLFSRELVSPFIDNEGNSMCADFADIDGDDDLDLFVGQTHGRPDWVYRNQGGNEAGVEGTFSRVTVGPLGIDRGETSDCVWIDMDGDDDLDVVLANRDANGKTVSDKRNALYIRVGANTNPRQAFGPLSGAELTDTYGVAVGDLNKDGLLDVVFANQSEPNQVFRNEGRQWTDEGGRSTVNLAPRIGWDGNLIETEENELRLFDAQPNSIALLWANFTTLPVPALGGTVIPELPVPAQVPLATDGLGAVALPFTVGEGVATALDALESIYIQWVCQDDGAPDGASLSNAARVREPKVGP